MEIGLDAKLNDLLHTLADCSKARSVCVDGYKAVYGGLHCIDD